MPARLVVAGLLAVAIGTFAVSLLTSLLRPLPLVPWHDGVLIATLDRLSGGGIVYPGFGDTAIGAPETPYFPGNVLLLIPLVWIFPNLIELLPRILGVTSALALFGVVSVASARLTRAPVPATAVTLLVFSALLYGDFRFQAQSFFPDFLMVALATGACLVITKRNGALRVPDVILLGCLSFLVGTLKQSSGAVLAGLAGFAFFRVMRHRTETKAPLLAVTLGGLAAFAVVMAIPNAIDATIVSMSRHPLVLKRLLDDMPALIVRYVWIVPPIVVAAAHSALAEKPLTNGLLFAAVPLFVFQGLAWLKAGGGLYDWNLPFFLLVPLVALSVIKLWQVGRHPWMVVGILATAMVFDARAIMADLSAVMADSGPYSEAVRYLEQYRGQPVLYDTYSYRLVRDAGLIPLTDLHTLAHYALAGERSGAVLQALDQQLYSLIIVDDIADIEGTSGQAYYEGPVMQAYNEAIQRNYKTHRGSNVPPYLERRLLGRASYRLRAAQRLAGDEDQEQGGDHLQGSEGEEAGARAVQVGEEASNRRPEEAGALGGDASQGLEPAARLLRYDVVGVGGLGAIAESRPEAVERCCHQEQSEVAGEVEHQVRGRQEDGAWDGDGLAAQLVRHKTGRNDHGDVQEAVEAEQGAHIGHTEAPLGDHIERQQAAEGHPKEMIGKGPEDDDGEGGTPVRTDLAEAPYLKQGSSHPDP